MNFIYSRSRTNSDLLQILEVQKSNLFKNLSEEEREKEGFVTVSHTFEQLQKMNEICSHIIVKVDNIVVGFALCMTRSFSNEIEILKPMFQELEKIVSKAENYIVMGQICIAKEYRRKGIFKKLYLEMKNAIKKDYNLIITEVDSKNERSLRAHASVGFRHLKTYTSNQQEWQIISLNV